MNTLNSLVGDIVLPDSPYYEIRDQKEYWLAKTHELVSIHPFVTLQIDIKAIVLDAWHDILNTRIGELQVGHDILFEQRVIGDLFHELIPRKLGAIYPNLFKKDETKEEKDIVYLPNASFSVEIKTSGEPESFFGNRNIALRTKDGRNINPDDRKTHKKHKSGYYLVINTPDVTTGALPKLIRFGWIDHIDWMAQNSPTGQQSMLSPFVRRNKLIVL